MLETVLIGASCAVLGGVGGWLAHPVGASLVTRRRVDELDQRISDLTERFGAFQRRELARHARAEKELGGDIATQAAAILAAGGNGTRRGPALSFKDQLRRRARLTREE